MKIIKGILKRYKRELQIKKLPWRCRHCEILGECRDEAHGWKCRHGCLVLKNGTEMKGKWRKK